MALSFSCASTLDKHSPSENDFNIPFTALSHPTIKAQFTRNLEKWSGHSGWKINISKESVWLETSDKVLAQQILDKMNQANIAKASLKGKAGMPDIALVWCQQFNIKLLFQNNSLALKASQEPLQHHQFRDTLDSFLNILFKEALPFQLETGLARVLLKIDVRNYHRTLAYIKINSFVEHSGIFGDKWELIYKNGLKNNYIVQSFSSTLTCPDNLVEEFKHLKSALHKKTPHANIFAAFGRIETQAMALGLVELCYNEAGIKHFYQEAITHKYPPYWEASTPGKESYNQLINYPCFLNSFYQEVLPFYTSSKTMLTVIDVSNEGGLGIVLIEAMILLGISFHYIYIQPSPTEASSITMKLSGLKSLSRNPLVKQKVTIERLTFIEFTKKNPKVRANCIVSTNGPLGPFVQSPKQTLIDIQTFENTLATDGVLMLSGVNRMPLQAEHFKQSQLLSGFQKLPVLDEKIYSTDFFIKQLITANFNQHFQFYVLKKAAAPLTFGHYLTPEEVPFSDKLSLLLKEGNLQAIKTFFNQNIAAINLKNHMGYTPLMVVATTFTENSFKLHQEVIRFLLLEKYADATINSNSRRNVIDELEMAQVPNHLKTPMVLFLQNTILLAEWDPEHPKLRQFFEAFGKYQEDFLVLVNQFSPSTQWAFTKLMRALNYKIAEGFCWGFATAGIRFILNGEMNKFHYFIGLIYYFMFMGDDRKDFSIDRNVSILKKFEERLLILQSIASEPTSEDPAQVNLPLLREAACQKLKINPKTYSQYRLLINVMRMIFDDVSLMTTFGKGHLYSKGYNMDVFAGLANTHDPLSVLNFQQDSPLYIATQSALFCGNEQRLGEFLRALKNLLDQRATTNVAFYLGSSFHGIALAYTKPQIDLGEKESSWKIIDINQLESLLDSWGVVPFIAKAATFAHELENTKEKLLLFGIRAILKTGAGNTILAQNIGDFFNESPLLVANYLKISHPLVHLSPTLPVSPLMARLNQLKGIIPKPVSVSIHHKSSLLSQKMMAKIVRYASQIGDIKALETLAQEYPELLKRALELPNIKNHTALSLAAWMGHLHIVRYLVNLKANPHRPSGPMHLSPAIIAAEQGHELVACYLSSVHSPTIERMDAKTPMLKRPDPRLIKYFSPVPPYLASLRAETSGSNITSISEQHLLDRLESLVRTIDNEAFKRFIKQYPALINHRDHHGETPLFITIMGLVETNIQICQERVHFLLENGGDESIPNYSGRTVLDELQRPEHQTPLKKQIKLFLQEKILLAQWNPQNPRIQREFSVIPVPRNKVIEGDRSQGWFIRIIKALNYTESAGFCAGICLSAMRFTLEEQFHSFHYMINLIYTIFYESLGHHSLERRTNMLKEIDNNYSSVPKESDIFSLEEMACRTLALDKEDYSLYRLLIGATHLIFTDVSLRQTFFPNKRNHEREDGRENDPAFFAKHGQSILDLLHYRQKLESIPDSFPLQFRAKKPEYQATTQMLFRGDEELLVGFVEALKNCLDKLWTPPIAFELSSDGCVPGHAILLIYQTNRSSQGSLLNSSFHVLDANNLGREIDYQMIDPVAKIKQASQNIKNAATFTINDTISFEITGYVKSSSLSQSCCDRINHFFEMFAKAENTLYKKP